MAIAKDRGHGPTDWDEFALIARMLRPLARSPGALDLRDDAALMVPPRAGHRLVLTKDLLVAGVHYLPDDPPAGIARKLVRVNVSDLAAMGATARACLLGLALGPEADRAWMQAFARGLGGDLKRYGLELLGGDITATPGATTLSLTAIGEVAAGKALLRSRARVGDDVYVSGTLGDAALGLAWLGGDLEGLSPRHGGRLASRYRRPAPRPALGRALVGIARAAIDVSDGVVGDLGHICAASGVGAEIVVAALPLSASARAALRIDPGRWEAPLSGGDDYELLFTAPPVARERLARLATRLGLALSRIGRIVPGGGVAVLDRSGASVALTGHGYRHRF